MSSNVSSVFMYRRRPQYRTTKNYKDGEFLGPRIGDKIFIRCVCMRVCVRPGLELKVLRRPEV